MKFLYSLAAISMCVGLNTTYAQLKPEIGVKAGLSIPNLSSGSSTPISSGYSSRFDADAAIHMQFHISNGFYIQPQLEYSSQGGKKNGTQAFTPPDEISQQFPPGQAPLYVYADYKSEAKMNYLMLPILAKFHFSDWGKRFGTYVATGPFVSYLLKAKNITKGSSIIYLDEAKKTPISPSPQSFDHKDIITGDLHRFNVGISGHVGVDYKLEKGLLFLEAGGNYGFIDIQKNSVNGKNKTGAAVINLGYQYRL